MSVKDRPTRRDFLRLVPTVLVAAQLPLHTLIQVEALPTEAQKIAFVTALFDRAWDAHFAKIDAILDAQNWEGWRAN